MFRNWMIGCAFIVAAVACWNEYRLWNRRARQTPMQVVGHVPMTGDEECVVSGTLELTCQQKQTCEPPITESEPVAEALTVMPRPLCDSSDCAQSTVADVWQAIGNLFDSTPLTGEETSEPKFMPSPWQLMPRLLPQPYRCPQSSDCPYLGGSSHPQHHTPVTKPTKPAGEEEQFIPLKPTFELKRKEPKLDTMEVRPGDLPSNWPLRPF